MLLKLGLVAAFLFTSGFFIFYFFKLYKFYKARVEPKSRGEIRKAKIYALTVGLLPWEKESTKKNWLLYITGIIYHLAIAVSFLRLADVFLDSRIFSSRLIFFFLIFGAACGLGLFFRRWLQPELRQLSFPDDYLANLLVDFFLLTGAISLLFPKAKIYFLFTGLVLILYLPFGKIRHCVFFIPCRLIFGHYYGLRGVLPPPKNSFFRSLLLVLAFLGPFFFWCQFTYLPKFLGTF